MTQPNINICLCKCVEKAWRDESGGSLQKGMGEGKKTQWLCNVYTFISLKMFITRTYSCISCVNKNNYVKKNV